MILWSQSLACGNATKLLLAPVAGATAMRLLRKTTAISGPDDPGAFLADSASEPGGMADDLVSLDAAGLVNGTSYVYQDFWLVGNTWVAGGTPVNLTPSATYTAQAPDPQTILLDRLDAGLRVEVARGELYPSSTLDAIEVLRSPPRFEDARFPLVTVEFQGGKPSERSIGDQWAGPQDLGASSQDTIGWLRRTDLVVTAWALNPDERLAMRLALERILAGNLPVFSALGLDLIDIHQTDMDDFESYGGVPVHTSAVQFSCTHLVSIGLEAATKTASVSVGVVVTA